MTNLYYLTIIIGIWSIIPAGVVSLVLFMRILADERRIEGMEIRKLDLDNVENSLTQMRNKIAVTESNVLSLQESLLTMNNKWNSRLRFENSAERKAEAKKDKNNGSADLDGVNGDAIPEQFRLPLNMPVDTPPKQIRRRAFGEYPQ